MTKQFSISLGPEPAEERASSELPVELFVEVRTCQKPEASSQRLRELTPETVFILLSRLALLVFAFNTQL